MMTESAEDIISKQQIILDKFFNFLGTFAYDKAKEFLDKERELAVKNHSVAPFFSSSLSAFATLATTEKNYANLIFLGSKGFLRKDSSLKSMYENLINEFQRLEVKHYVSPATTPTISPSSYSPISSGLPSPSLSSSETSSTMSSAASSLRGSSLHTYLGEDILENLASHLCGQLLSFVQARLRMMEFYEKMYAMGSMRFMKFDLLLSAISDIVKKNVKLFHHPMLSPLKSVFSLECEILMKLLEAEINMQNWKFLPSLLCLHDAHSKLGTLISQPREMKKSITGSYRTPPIPTLYIWLRSLKAALVSKFTLYFHEILSKQTTMTFWAKASTDYFSKIVAFQKKNDAAIVAIVLDTNGLEDYNGHGYSFPGKYSECPTGLDSFPSIVSFPPNCFIQEKHSTHWPSIVMIMNNKEQEIRNTETAVSFFDSRMNATFFLSKIEYRTTLVVIFENKKMDKDAHIHKFIQAFCTQLRGNKLFTSLKPGSK